MAGTEARALISTLPVDADNLFVVLTARELDIKNESGANIIGMKRLDNSILINPLPETMLEPSDKLFALGTRKQISSLFDLISQENN